MKIRDMTINDVPSIKLLMQRLGYYNLEYDVLEERFKSITNSPEHHIFVSEIDGKVVGLLHIFGKLAFKKPKEAVIQAIATDELYTGKGIGNNLLEAGEKWAITNGFDTITVWTSSAHAFYEHLGYKNLATSEFFQKKLI